MRSNKKPLYQPWNEEEFMSDTSVRIMTTLQRWMYRTLLQASFFHTTRPYLPNDNKVLWILAGCESINQWESNKDAVLGRFTTVKGNRKLLENKRVTEDWSRLEESRERMAELGRKSAAVKRTFNGRSTAVQQDIGIVKGKEKVIERESEEEIDVSLKNDITDKARLILGIRLNPQSNDWSEIKALSRVYENHRIVDAFESWAKTRRGEMIAYPLSEFIKVADGIIGGIIDISDDGNLDKVLADLYQVADQAFAGKYKLSVKELVKKYGQDEVLSAYREFVDNLNEYQKSFAVRDFCEGGAVGVIGARKNRSTEIEELKRIDILTDNQLKINAERLQEQARLRDEAEDEPLPI